MHEKSPVLTAKARERVGTRYADRVRKAGGMPINLYGKGHTPIAASVDAHEFLAHVNKGEKIFRVNLDGVMKDQVVLLTGIQFDWMGNNPVHADLARVALTDRVKTRVPLHLIGEATGLKQAGAILLHPTNELEVECVVTDIPDFIEVNIGTLDVGHAITVSEVKLPSSSIKVLTDKNHIVAQIVIQQETVVAEATAAAAGPAEPEVLTAKKPAEGEAAAGAKPAAGKDAKAPAAPKK